MSQPSPVAKVLLGAPYPPTRRRSSSRDRYARAHGTRRRKMPCDMVQYFGEQLAGYAFTKYGWVHSYGFRCVSFKSTSLPFAKACRYAARTGMLISTGRWSASSSHPRSSRTRRRSTPTCRVQRHHRGHHRARRRRDLDRVRAVEDGPSGGVHERSLPERHRPGPSRAWSQPPPRRDARMQARPDRTRWPGTI
jgi:Cobalamin-independent synthase, Catalytic domain